MGSHYVAQTGFKILTSSDIPALASQAVRTTSTYPYTLLGQEFIKDNINKPIWKPKKKERRSGSKSSHKGLMIEKNVIGWEYIVYILLRNKGRRENKRNTHIQSIWQPSYLVSV
jgi:hypothetical protein